MSFGYWGLHTAGSDYSYGDGFRRYEKARNAGEKPHLYHAIANEWQPGNSILSPNLRFDGDHDQMLDLFHRNWGDQNEPSHESFYFVHLTPHLNEAHHIAEDTGRTRVLEIDPDKLSNTVNLGDEGYPAVYDEVNPEAIVGIHPAKHLHNNPDPYVRHVDGCDGLGDSCCGRAPSPHTASTNGIHYAHVVEADVDDDLHRLGMAQDEWAPNYVEHPASKPEDDGKVTLYHRTQPDRADAILKNQRLHPGDYWSSLLPPGEATPEDYEDDPVWFATSPEGRYPHFADTYGSAVLKVRVPADKIHWADGRRAQPGEVLHAAVYPRHLKGLPIERHAATRLAMPWPDWAPKVQGGCQGCDGTGDYGEYYIDHPDGSGKQPGDIMPGLNGRSVLHFYHDTGADGQPELYVSGLHTDSNHRQDGVAESLMRHLHQSHPDTRINPGFMTDDGQAFHDRMLSKEPDAKGTLTPRFAMPAPMPEGITFHYHDTDDDLPVAPGGSAPFVDGVYDPADYSDEPETPMFHSPAVEARHHGKYIGHLAWEPHHGGSTVKMIDVQEPYRRHGIGTALFDFARQHEPNLEHDDPMNRTDLGNAWIKHEQSRTARKSLEELAQAGYNTDDWEKWQQGGCIEYAHALKQRHPHLGVGIVSTPDDEDNWQHIFVHDDTHAYDSAGAHPLPYTGVHGDLDQHLGHDLDWYDDPDPDLVELAHQHIDRHGIGPKGPHRTAAVDQNMVDRLHGEFHDWWTRTGQSYLREPERGPIGEWPHVENFLKERYPAAHKGHNMGNEETGPLLDGGGEGFHRVRNTDPYETGPDAVAKHGYDPKEIAAGMLLLHNRSHPNRSDLEEGDQDRLAEIARIRSQQQRAYEQRNARTAMPAPLPEGITFHYHSFDWDDPNHRPGVCDSCPGDHCHSAAHPPSPLVPPYTSAPFIQAVDEKGNYVGHLNIGWETASGKELDDMDEDDPLYDEYNTVPDDIHVEPEYRRQSVANGMFDFAKVIYPELQHSRCLSELGKSWSDQEKSRTAAVNQNMVDRLHGEFHDWWDQNKDDLFFPEANPHGRGPLGHWPNIESFLADRYPAAHKGFNTGYEQARVLVDWNKMYPHEEPGGHQRYETGPEAEAQHGYDPKEVAASMLLLHNQSDPLRGDLAQDDQDRLTDIFTKRQQMQRAYEQRQTTAGLHGDLPEGITFQHHEKGFEPFPDVIMPTVPVSNSSPMVSAHDGDRMIGHIQWRDDGHPRRNNEIWDLRVHPDYQRRGVATALFDWVTDKINPDLKHSTNLSDEGRAFAEHEVRRPLADERYEAWRNDQPMPKRFAGLGGDTPAPWDH